MKRLVSLILLVCLALPTLSFAGEKDLAHLVLKLKKAKNNIANLTNPGAIAPNWSTQSDGEMAQLFIGGVLNLQISIAESNLNTVKKLSRALPLGKDSTRPHVQQMIDKFNLDRDQVNTELRKYVDAGLLDPADLLP